MNWYYQIIFVGDAYDKIQDDGLNEKDKIIIKAGVLTYDKDRNDDKKLWYKIVCYDFDYADKPQLQTPQYAEQGTVDDDIGF